MHQLINQKRRNANTQGFTLIELMVGVAIVGILAAFAVPMFNSYMTRARVAEAVNYANGCKIGWADHVNLSGARPTDLGQINCETFTSENIEAVRIATGFAGIRVDLQGTPPFPAEVANGAIFLQPLSAQAQVNPQGAVTTEAVVAGDGDTIVGWRCGFAGGAATGGGLAVTQDALDAASSYLPSGCRNLPLAL